MQASCPCPTGLSCSPLLRPLSGGPLLALGPSNGMGAFDHVNPMGLLPRRRAFPHAHLSATATGPLRGSASHLPDFRRRYTRGRLEGNRKCHHGSPVVTGIALGLFRCAQRSVGLGEWLLAPGPSSAVQCREYRPTPAFGKLPCIRPTTCMPVPVLSPPEGKPLHSREEFTTARAGKQFDENLRRFFSANTSSILGIFIQRGTCSAARRRYLALAGRLSRASLIRSFVLPRSWHVAVDRRGHRGVGEPPSSSKGKGRS